MKKLNLFKRAIFFFSLSIALNSCSSFNPEPTVKNLETCLGNYKTMDDLYKMTKSERIEISKCILPHLKELDDQANDMSKEEKIKAYEKINEILEKSEYKEVIKTMNYEGVKSFLEENGVETK